MVQCNKCDHWVHAACESMSDQEYEILSDLPEDAVTFLCRLCSPGEPNSFHDDNTPRGLPWKVSVDKYLQDGLAKVCTMCGWVHFIW